MEQAFLQLMWFFRVPSQNEFNRLKVAMFQHLGVVPQGVTMLTAQERYNPDPRYIEMAKSLNVNLKQEAAASFTQNFQAGSNEKEKTATEVMARVNEVNELVSGMLDSAYEQQEPQYREICRRLCLPYSKDSMAKEFQKLCLKDGVPEEMLDVDNWEIEVERAVGGGNQTAQMAIIGFLNNIRKNMGPQGQRIIDHMSVFASTQQSDLAEEIAPLKELNAPSRSMEDAMKLTPRLMEGLPVQPAPDMIYEDFVKAWLQDMTTIMGQVQQKGLPTPDELKGLQNMAMHVGQYLKIMASDDEAKPKVKQYGHLLGQLVNHLKGFGQRLGQAMQAQQKQQGNGVDAKTAAQRKGKLMIDQAKAQNLVQSHATRTAQRQVQFEAEESRKDRQTNAEIRRKNLLAQADARAQAMRTHGEIANQHLRTLMEPHEPPQRSVTE
jgi:hypothetical protein